MRGDLAAMYADLVHAQHGSYNALIDDGRHALVSATPELFVEWSGARAALPADEGHRPARRYARTRTRERRPS